MGGLGEEGGGVGLGEGSLRRCEWGRREDGQSQVGRRIGHVEGTYVDEVLERVSDRGFGLHAVDRTQRDKIKSALAIVRLGHPIAADRERLSRALTVRSLS